MIELNFHWAWLVMTALVILGVVIYIRNYDNGSSLQQGLNMLFGIAALVFVYFLHLLSVVFLFGNITNIK